MVALALCLVHEGDFCRVVRRFRAHCVNVIYFQSDRGCLLLALIEVGESLVRYGGGALVEPLERAMGRGK